MTTLTSDCADAPSPRSGRKRRALPEVSDRDLDGSIREILNRRPAVGLAVGVVRGLESAFFHGHGLADIPSRLPITEDTIFRIGSITKLFTAIAVMQLVEDGRVDLDAPANDYLRAYKVIPAQADWRPATVRHLLTHTAGIPEIRGVADLLNASLMPSGGRPGPMSVDAGLPLPSLATYYGDGLRIVVEPGTAFAYSNHTERKARTRTNLGVLMIGGGLGRRLMLMAVMRQRVNVMSASIPGPRVPLYLAGAKVLEVFPVLPLIANEPLGVGALSYAGALTIGIAADRDAYPDLDVFVAGLRAELQALGVSADLPPGAALMSDVA